ncbi:quercetin 2,3-dioxygenase [Mumia flava]|uniref:Quercetin 2,3-dioxygenase n=1 Tax=Mumia flava TaxID=1348852 RepID=A0A0B2B9T9_9ACTN|nr:quercetin 2,3-dioxygenase [Mumia flava]PJJ48217.1 quercetin 2,3-dioxygenase [Mumia flava]
MTTLDLESVHQMRPVVDTLPGEPVPYAITSGEGQRYEVDGQLWTVVARAADSGNAFDAAFVLGPRGASAPFHSLAEHQRSYVVFEGSVQVWLPGESRVLGTGDTIHVPPGVPVAYRMLSEMTKLLFWSAPGGALDALLEGESPVATHVYPAADVPPPSGRLIVPGGASVHDLPQVDARDGDDVALPGGVEPYFLRAGEGDRRMWPDAVNAFSARGRNTGGRYIAVTTIGARQPYIPRHFHSQHTENFFCLSGRIWLWVNGEQVLLTPGDYVHAPAGTIHSFALGGHATRMLGILTTDVFEPFFDRTGPATDDHVYTEGMIDPSVMMGRLQEISDLDVTMVGPPPETPAGL